MFHIASTRFNNATFAENMAYRQKKEEIVLYGTSISTHKKYTVGSIFAVFEMNNEENRIEGIGLITNNIVFDKKHKIYSDSDYNRFIYRGKYWIGREQLLVLDEDLVTIFDKILFKGKSHLKRQSGITVVTEKLTKKWDHDLAIMKRRVKGLFINTFKMQKDIGDEDEDEKEINEIDTNLQKEGDEDKDEELIIEVK